MPQSLRPARLLLVLGLALSALVVLASGALADTYAGSEDAFVRKINAERKSAGLSQLVTNVELVRVARAWTDQMAATKELEHNPDLAKQVLADWQRLGENVGYTTKTGASEAELVDRLHQAFMASPGHRRNVLGDYNQVGVGATIAADGTMWVTVNFMKAPLADARQIHDAVRVSQELFGASGDSGRQASYVVLGRADVFADLLAGAGLAGRNGPVLLTPGPSASDPSPVLAPSVRAEIDRVLGGSGTVYVLGGPRAVSDAVAAELSGDGYTVKRLAGSDRLATAVAVARETARVHGQPDQVLIARADLWPDAVVGGAYAAYSGTPVLLTGSRTLSPETAALLSEWQPARRWVLGGPQALSDGVVKAAKATRVAGADRYATAVAIAERLWGRSVSAHGTDGGFVTVPGRDPLGWAFALARAPQSAIEGKPQLLVDD